ncbi:hypothetical protein KCH_21250 [Kitasatospora cheerisanensis KCTC 2395]|uniref:Uncharacterized protein n=1 Tax=Kitasatospora cheerisanensis KCTC 2395 TaxID=1348663 RepID=A0A066YXN4_9ACTN|nr:hypothetical protein KCH_21250 [Kitasatospora cheerisanensis KCTC 2395]
MRVRLVAQGGASGVLKGAETRMVRATTWARTTASGIAGPSLVPADPLPPQAWRR